MTKRTPIFRLTKHWNWLMMQKMNSGRTIPYLITVIFISVMFATPISLSSKSRHHIRTTWGAYDPEEIHFVSGDNKVTKRLPAWTEDFEDYEVKGLQIRTFSEIHVAKNGAYALRIEESKLIDKKTRETAKNQKISVKLSYFSAEGKVLWKKEFEVFAISHTIGKSLYNFCISPSGEAMAFFVVSQRKRKDVKTEMWIFNQFGKEIVHSKFNGFLEKPEISHDGEIIGAYMQDKTLFFFEVKTGRKKVVNAQGNNWDGFFILSSSSFPPPRGKIRIGWRPLVPRENETLGKRILTKDMDFGSLPSSLRDFFRGKK